MLDLATYKIKHEELEGKIRHYTSLHDEADKRASSLSQSIVTTGADIKKLQKKIEDCSDDIAKYRKQHAEANKILVKSKSEYSKFSESMKGLRSRNVVLQGFASTVKCAAKQSVIIEGLLQGARAKRVDFGMTSALKKMTADVAKLEQKITSLRLDHRKWSADLLTKKRLIRRMKSDHEDAKDVRLGYQGKIDSLKIQLRALEQAQQA
jgi:uncharacterized coiled-coil DUF342 family protein